MMDKLWIGPKNKSEIGIIGQGGQNAWTVGQIMSLTHSTQNFSQTENTEGTLMLLTHQNTQTK